MTYHKVTRLSRMRWWVRLLLTGGLTMLLLIVLLYGLWGARPAYANPGTLYVHGATGSDTGNCQNPAAPCRTIGYAISQAGNGDTILVTVGTYTENLVVDGVTLTLRGR